MPTSKRRKPNAVGEGQQALFPNGFEPPESGNGEKALSVRDLLRLFPGSRLAALHQGPPKRTASTAAQKLDNENPTQRGSQTNGY